ncbi:MAG TPA: hypothetical protein VN963_05720, partial [bacterium]|nr:hypothetical protein [bacterium]
EALESVEKTLTLDPENAKALHLKGNLLLWEWQWKEAQAAIRESLRIVPTNGEAAIDLRLIQILRVIRWPFLFSCISFWNFFDTHNAASLMAGVAFGFLIIFCADFVEAEGKLRKAMRIVAPFLITLGVLSVTFFSQAHPWYHDWAAWLFGTLFCSLCINPEKVYFSEERGFDLKAWAELVWPMILFVSLFFLNPAGVMLGLNGGLLITRFNWLNKTRPGRWFKFHRFLRFLSVPFIVWMAGSTYWDWQACTAWYGNGDVWGDEVAYFVLLVWLESGTPKEEKVNQPVSTKPLLEGNHE